MEIRYSLLYYVRTLGVEEVLNQEPDGCRPAHVWFIEISFFFCLGSCVCVCVCVCACVCVYVLCVCLCVYVCVGGWVDV